MEGPIDISQAITICLNKHLPFVVFRLPGSKEVNLYVQKKTEVEILGRLSDQVPENGFLVAPFSRENDKAFLIKSDLIIHDPVDVSLWNELNNIPEIKFKPAVHSQINDTSKEEYKELIKKSIEKIEAGDFEKVVLSRIKTIHGNFYQHLPFFFKELCSAYPKAFVYLFQANGQCWTGATPEPFICSEDDFLKTVSLAGTRNYQEKNLDLNNWNNKELLEQEYVTRHIEKTLKNFDIELYRKNGPYIEKAGNIVHLRTDFHFPYASVGIRLPSLIAALHPTPAVCGMSTGNALDFIRQVEKHKREYYAGFLGPVNNKNDIRLYVNLRCLKVYDNRLILYIGGGITKESDPEEEWDETELKAETLLSVLKHIR